MKKTALLLVATLFALAFNTNAQKLQFALWDNKVPDLTDAQIITTSNAIAKGQSFAGVTLRANPENYKEVFGEKAYVVLANAPDADFTVGPSKGGELNWGIDNATKKSIVTGTLAPGVKCVWYKGVLPVYKWGTNGCVNALSLPAVTNDPVDKDNLVSKPGNQPNMNNTLNPSGINITVNGQPQNGQELSWRTGKGVYDEGRMDYRLAMYDAMAMQQMQSRILIEMQNSKQCCNQTAPTQIVQPTQQVVYQQQPSLYTNTSSYNPGQQSQNLSGNVNVTVKEKTRAIDIINTVFNGARAAAEVKTAFWGQDINVHGLNNVVGTTTGYNNTWGNNGTGVIFNDGNRLVPQGMSYSTAAFSGLGVTTTNTGYNNTWTGGGGGMRLIGQ